MAVNLSYIVQSPDEGMAILTACRRVAASTRFSRLTGLYAFASEKGARLLVNELRESPSWRTSNKRWVISIDGGITQPEALRFLIGLPNTEVRVPNAEDLLVSRLRPKHRFHPKTLLFERGAGPFSSVAMLVGSGNLTFTGLCYGHEHAMSVAVVGDDLALPAGIATGVSRLEKELNAATPIDLAFVERYAAARPITPSIPEAFEDERADLIMQDRAVVPPLQAAALAAAKHFWIEIEYVVENRGRHEEGNQIDMQRGSRVFFGFGDASKPRNSPIGSVRIAYGDHSAPRNLRFGNNSMDKLDLPIPDVEGPPSYRNHTLLFTREGRGTFQLFVGTPADIANWKAKSRAAGTLFSMRSGREFDVF